MGPVIINGSVHTARKQHQRKNTPICTCVASRILCKLGLWFPLNSFQLQIIHLNLHLFEFSIMLFKSFFFFELCGLQSNVGGHFCIDEHKVYSVTDTGALTIPENVENVVN